MLLKFIFVCLLFLAIVNAVSVDEIIAEEWNLFKIQYGKNYESILEEEYRFGIFKETKFEIAKHNKLFTEGKVTYELGLNHLSDLMPNEISTGLSGNLSDSWIDNVEVGTFVSNPYIVLPMSVDWRTEGAVTNVKNQGADCNSGWAFAAIGTLEGYHHQEKHELVSLSAQNLIDCSKTDKNLGCGGGYIGIALNYMKRYGINYDTSYPYEGKDGPCRFDKNNEVVTFDEVCGISSEKHLLEVIANKGPVAASINSKDPDFINYKSGVYDKLNSPKDITHAVLIIGYGTENKKNYWLVKNSWGTDWGDRGYMKILRDENVCGIATRLFYSCKNF